MTKVLVIGSRNSGKKNNSVVMAANLEQRGIEADAVFWEDILIEIKSGQVKIYFNQREALDYDPDLVLAVGWYKNGHKSIYRDLAYSLALYLEYNKIKFWNSEMLKQRSTTKLSCMVELALANISVPDTYFAFDKVNLANQIKMPFIMKAVAASRGRNNYLVQDDSVLNQVINDDNYYIVQEYLENDHDLRVICFAGLPVLVLKRSRGADSEGHLNNVSQGASAEWLEQGSINPSLLTNSEKICKVTKREMAGIDFIPDKTSDFGYSCLEVNAVPQLTSGADVDRKMSALADCIQKITERKD